MGVGVRQAWHYDAALCVDGLARPIGWRHQAFTDLRNRTVFYRDVAWSQHQPFVRHRNDNAIDDCKIVHRRNLPKVANPSSVQSALYDCNTSPRLTASSYLVPSSGVGAVEDKS